MAPSRAVLAERVKGERRLRRQQRVWDRMQRKEDRIDRAKKDEELNGVRFQLSTQASTFATKDSLIALEKAIVDKLDVAVGNLEKQIHDNFERINSEGTVTGRIGVAKRAGEEEAAKELLDSQGLTRRWLLGLIVVFVIALVGWLITLGLFVANHLITP